MKIVIVGGGKLGYSLAENLLEEMRVVATEALDHCQNSNVKDWAAIKAAIKNDLSGFLYKKTKRNPMILPVIMEI